MTEAAYKNRKNLLKNVGYLFLAQGVNYIFPLLTLPYLTYKLGMEGFGIYAFAQVTILYFQAFTDYGFNLTATRKLAIAQNNKKKIEKIFWSVLAVKMILGVIATVAGALLLIFLNPNNEMKRLYIYSFFAVWGSIFFPLWYFQGLESMQKIAWINFVSKLIGIGLLFCLVQDKEDIALAGFVQAMPSVLSAVLACFLIYKSKQITKIKIDWQEIKVELVAGWYIFVTSFFSMVVANSGVFFLGLYHNAQIVGIYASSEKVVKAAVGLFAPITQAIYPNNVKAFSQSKYEGFRVIKKTGLYVSILALSAALFLWLLSPYIATLFMWEDARHVHVIKFLAPWLFLGILNNIFGVQVLTAMGASKLYSKLFVVASIVLLVILILFVRKYDLSAVLVSMCVAEGMLTILLMYSVYKIWNSR